MSMAANRDVQRMLERQGLAFLKGPFGENIENSRPPSYMEAGYFQYLIPRFYTARAILST